MPGAKARADPPTTALPWRWLHRALAQVAGTHPYWEGVDLFRFENGRLIGKYTYGQTRLPRIRRSE